MNNKQRNKIIHVEFNEYGSHHYFGSIAAIFEVFSSEEIGVTQHRLYDFNIESGKPYKNDICTIRKGRVVRKKGNRLNPIHVKPE